MHKLFSRTTRKVAAIFGVLAVAASTLGATTPPATSPGTLHAVSLKQLTGTPDFDEKSGPGMDISATDDVIRTNDTITYNVEVQTGMTASRASRIEIKLPSGEQAKVLPPYCLPATSSATPAIADPARVLTADSYKSLPAQTISCDLGKLNANQSYVYPIYSTVRPEVPNGVKLGEVSAKVIADHESLTTNGVSHTASAAPRFDVQMGFREGVDRALTDGPGSVLCEADPDYGCFSTRADVTVSAPAGGKGISPLAGSYEFHLDVHPDTFYGPGTTDSPGWKKAAELTEDEKAGKSTTEQEQASFDKAWSRYKPDLTVRDGIYYGPHAVLTSKTNVDNSVRHSGNLVSKWDGTNLVATVTGADTSAWTFPETNSNGAHILPKDRAFVADHRISLFVPGFAVDELSLESRNGLPASGIRTLPNRLHVSEMTANGLDGATNKTYRDEENNYRHLNAVLRSSGSWSAFLTGVPGQKGNTKAKDFQPGNDAWEGLPGSSRVHQGDGMLMEGQTGIYSNRGSLSKGVLPAVGNVACNTWDDRLKLTAGDYGPSIYSMGIPSDGRAAWLSNVWSNTPETVSVKIQYGRGLAGKGDDSTCENKDSVVGWHDSPEKVPGNDPAQLTNGIYTGINKVRILSASTSAAAVRFDIAVALSYQGGSKNGDAIPVWSALSSTLELDSLDTTFEEAFVSTNISGKPFGWSTKSSYQTGPTSSDSFFGGAGDRLIIGDAYSSVGLEVMDGAGAWQPESAEFEAGSGAQFRIDPAVSAAVDTGKKFSPTVEVCLPAGASLVGNKSSIQPSGFSTTNLKGTHQECEPGGTLVTWNLNGYEANKAIPPITFYASSHSAMEDMSVQVKAVIGLADEVGRLKDRTDTANMNLMSPMTAGFDLTVDGGKSLIDVDPLVNSSNPQTPAWKFEYFNRGNNGHIGDVDMTVVMPRNGYAGSTFHGTSRLVSLQATQGGEMAILFSTSKSVSVDSQGLVSGAGTWIPQAQHQGDLGDVTAIRVQRPGLLVSGEGIALVATTEVRNNRTGDVYKAIGSGGAGTFQGVQVNDDDDNAVAVKGGSVGDRVWADGDKDGLQDPNEHGIPDVPVALTGVTASGDKLPAKQATTNKDGLYGFDNLPAGTYTVEFDTQWMSKNQWDITEARTGRGINDSAPGIDGRYTFTLTAHNDLNYADAGLTGSAMLAISRETNRETSWIYRGQYPRQIVTIKNTGDFTITGINVTDTAVGPVVNDTARFEGTAVGKLTRDDKAISHTWSGTLTPGQSVKMSLHQRVDVNAEASKTIVNTVKGYGSWLGGSPAILCTTTDFTTAADCFATSKVADPTLEYTPFYTDSGATLKNAQGDLVLEEAKDYQANPRVEGKFGPGETVGAIQTVRNTGNVPLSLNSATMSLDGVPGKKSAVFSPVTIEPGKSAEVTFIDVGVATQKHIDTDSLYTRVETSSTGPNAYPFVDNGRSQKAPLNRDPQLTMSATAQDETGNGVVEPDEKARWRYTLVNTGNLTLSKLNVQDAVGGALIAEDGFSGALAPGSKVSMDRTGTVTFNEKAHEDEQDGQESIFRNVATASARAPLSTDGTLTSTATTLLSGRAESKLDLIKTLVDASGDGILSTGEMFHYEFNAVNNSDETYSSVRLEDPSFAAEYPTSSIHGPQAWAELPEEDRVLRPGQSAIWSTTQVAATAANAEAGFVENKASVSVEDSMGKAMRSNFSIARASAVGTPVMIAAGAGAGVQLLSELDTRTQASWVTVGAVLAVCALAILWLRRKSV